MRWQMIKDGVAQTIQHIKLIFLNGFPVAVLNALYQYFLTPMANTGEFDISAADGVRLGVILIFLTVAATSYYAYLFKIGLFGIDSVDRGFALRWGRLEWRLIGYSLLLFVAGGLIFVVLAAIFGFLSAVAGGAGLMAGLMSIVAFLLFFTAIIYLYPRLFLFWPIIVDDQPNPFKAMFDVCRHNTWFIWSIILLMMLLSIPAFIVIGLAGSPLGLVMLDEARGISFFVLQLLLQTIMLPVGAWFSFVLCKIYLHLKSGKQRT